MIGGGTWRDLLDNMTLEVRDTFGQTIAYPRKETGEVFEIPAVFDIAYQLSDAGGNVATNIPIKEVDIRLGDIGGKPPK